MKILKHGAEAILYESVLDGAKVLVKERVRKGYRIEEIDSKIRKLRTREEVKLLSESRGAGVPTPQIIRVDENENKIFMELIDGQRVKDYLKKLDKKKSGITFKDIGILVGKLHDRNIIHGDLTTSNMIIKDNKIYFIDFGLGMFSKRPEDKAIDLSLVFEALRSTHHEILDICWKNFLSGYKKEYKESGKVLKQLAEIEKRARYVSDR